MHETGQYHHAAAETFRGSMLRYVSLVTVAELAAHDVVESLGEELAMSAHYHEIGAVLAQVGLGQDDIEKAFDDALRKLVAPVAAKLSKGPASVPPDLEDTARMMFTRAWENAKEEAESTGGGRYPPAHLRSQLGRGAWDGFEPTPITGREAIEIHLRTPGSRLMVREPDGPEPITVRDAWNVIKDDPGAVYVDKPDHASWSGHPHRIAIVAVRRENVDAATETIKAAARQLTRPGSDDFSEPATVWEVTGQNVPDGLIGLEVSTEVSKVDVARARKCCAAYPDAFGLS